MVLPCLTAAYRTAIDPFDREADEFVFLPGGDHVEQRQIVIGCRNR